MNSFFQNLNKGKGRSESLRNAKLDYLRGADAIQANPYYWAGFVLFGETTPLERADPGANFWLYAIPIIVLILAAAALWIARGRKTSEE